MCNVQSSARLHVIRGERSRLGHVRASQVRCRRAFEAFLSAHNSAGVTRSIRRVLPQLLATLSYC
jgi:hypothetical protein